MFACSAGNVLVNHTSEPPVSQETRAVFCNFLPNTKLVCQVTAENNIGVGNSSIVEGYTQNSTAHEDLEFQWNITKEGFNRKLNVALKNKVGLEALTDFTATLVEQDWSVVYNRSKGFPSTHQMEGLAFDVEHNLTLIITNNCGPTVTKNVMIPAERDLPGIPEVTKMEFNCSCFYLKTGLQPVRLFRKLVFNYVCSADKILINHSSKPSASREAQATFCSFRPNMHVVCNVTAENNIGAGESLVIEGSTQNVPALGNPEFLWNIVKEDASRILIVTTLEYVICELSTNYSVVVVQKPLTVVYNSSARSAGEHLIEDLIFDIEHDLLVTISDSFGQSSTTNVTVPAAEDVPDTPELIQLVFNSTCVYLQVDVPQSLPFYKSEVNFVCATSDKTIRHTSNGLAMNEPMTTICELPPNTKITCEIYVANNIGVGESLFVDGTTLNLVVSTELSQTVASFEASSDQQPKSTPMVSTDFQTSPGQKPKSTSVGPTALFPIAASIMGASLLILASISVAACVVSCRKRKRKKNTIRSMKKPN